jgi:arginyl-tRNA synthetase
MLTTLKKILASHLAKTLQLSEDEIFKTLESPRDTALGDLAFPCFTLSKTLKQAPPKIAAELSQKFQNDLPGGYKKVQPAGGYLNFFFDEKFWAETILKEIQKKKLEIGDEPTIGNGKTAVFDYSSPNVAKPMSIGHLRSTVIGQSLVNVFKAMGYKTIGVNYLGDWGVQFGKLAWAHLNKAELLQRADKVEAQVVASGFNQQAWKGLIKDAQTQPDTSFDYLYAMYVVFHAVAEIDNDLEAKGREYFVKLERRNDAVSKNDPLTKKIEEAWQKFVSVSMVEYGRVYALLQTKHDIISGESTHEAELPGVVERLKKMGLLMPSEGAQIVDLSAYDMPPCLITKSDGATLYATRDIAAAEHRHDKLKGDKLFYVVGAEQSLHFKQYFKVLELMGHKWASDCTHVPFGLYRFKEGKMSTRRGNVVFLEDVLDRAVELVRNVIKEKNPDLKNAETVAKAVGTGAVIFNDLMNDRLKNIDFDWDRLLDFNGDTGPYVQYTHVRCCSVLHKWSKSAPDASATNLGLLRERLELEVLRVLGRFPDHLRLAYEQLKPNWIAQYTLDLSKAFNAFYYEHRILEGDLELQKARLILTDSTRIVLKKSLDILGIQAPEQM